METAINKNHVIIKKDPRLLDYQKKIEQSGTLLLSIINNVLDMASIESGRTEIDENYEKVDMMEGTVTVESELGKCDRFHFGSKCERKAV